MLRISGTTLLRSSKEGIPETMIVADVTIALVPVNCCMKGSSNPSIYALVVYLIVYSYLSFDLCYPRTTNYFYLIASSTNSGRVNIPTTSRAYSFLFFKINELGL